MRGDQQTETVPRKGILVVEDDEGVRSMLRLALELEGYLVFTAENGKEAFETLSRIPIPCVIISDLMMPIMDGWEFFELIKKEEALSNIPVVIVTAYGTRGIETKVQGFLKKPIDIEELFKFINRYCEDK